MLCIPDTECNPFNVGLLLYESNVFVVTYINIDEVGPKIDSEADMTNEKTGSRQYSDTLVLYSIILTTYIRAFLELITSQV